MWKHFHGLPIVPHSIFHKVYTLLPSWNPFRMAVTLSIVPRSIWSGLEAYEDLVNNLDGFAKDLSTALIYYLDPVQPKEFSICTGNANFEGSKIAWRIDHLKEMKENLSLLHAKAAGKDAIFKCTTLPKESDRTSNGLRMADPRWGSAREYVPWDLKEPDADKSTAPELGR